MHQEGTLSSRSPGASGSPLNDFLYPPALGPGGGRESASHRHRHHHHHQVHQVVQHRADVHGVQSRLGKKEEQDRRCSIGLGRKEEQVCRVAEDMEQMRVQLEREECTRVRW